jgi:CBS-domain-containing membrane protein
MRLDLDDSERMDLQTALELQLRSLREELAHTDDRDYRRSVRERLDRLEQVANRITRAQERSVAFEGKATTLSAGTVMHTHPLTALPEDLVLEVSGRMAEHDVRHMPVVDRAGHLLGIMPPGAFDLILCRNLVYTDFDEPTRATMTEAIRRRLVPGGVLIVGAHEQIDALSHSLAPYAGCRGAHVNVDASALDHSLRKPA